ETRGRRVGRRKYQLPLIGASLQIEDVFGPVSIILAFMVIWLKGAFSKAGESILICRQFFPDRSKLAPLVANAFFFLEWRPLGKNVQGNLRFHQRIIVFLLAPYLVIACGIIAYILDNVFLDYQQHCSTETFDSSPIRILVGWIIPVMLFAASMCAVSAWQMFKELHNVAIRLSRDLPKGAGTLRTQTTDLKRCYCWMVASPFLILGNFVVLSYLSGAYSRDYFPSTGYLVVFLTCLSITVFASAKLLTCKPEDLTKPAPIWTFLYWTTPLVIVLAFLYTVCSQEWNYVVLNKYLFIAAASLFAATVAMGIWMSLWVSKAPSKSDC
ncbi:MAG: hypothetical protein OEV80_01905, partial [candidate division Zixibacteria bacterium]|nr:hypothetical protein [candidate division Zixibacteria bacterium]